MTTLDPLQPDDHVDGPDDAELELVMYGDFQCPYCIAAHPIVERVREQLADRLRFVFRHFPIDDIHPLARKAAEAAEAAAAQGKFWEMYQVLYASRGKLSRAELAGYADQVGLDLEAFEAELDSGEHAERVQRDFETGEGSGISGTPAFFVNGTRHDGSFDAGSLISALGG
jgi:formate-nitrite transporter family protein